MTTLQPCGALVRVTSVVLSIFLAVSAQAQQTVAYRGTAVLDFAIPDEPTLKLPTSVAVAADGTVYVADGVNDRIAVFSPDGQFVNAIESVGSTPLHDPLGIVVGPDGTLWIADTRNRRVVACTPTGELVREIEISAEGEEKPADLVDLAIDHDGALLWVVDNDNHRVVRVDLQTGEQKPIGRYGESLGQFNYPYKIAVSSEGDVFVGDSINGRVEVLTSDGNAAGIIGTYGVDLGNLYRPKGVAVDAEGMIWVADGPLGVVQVFRRGGTAIDVLRDEAGQPIHFEMPCGIAIDNQGYLYVCELNTNSVKKLAIAVDERARLAARGNRARPGVTAQPRVCAACHLEWMEPFASGRSTVLGDPPENTADNPAVSRAGVCLSCHDGAVEDSRRRVWVEHGHRRSIAPPEGMKISNRLPLVDGKIECRTCHSAHVSGDPMTESLRDAVFLRVANKASELCISCHEDKTRGPELGTHPTGGMPWPVPQVLIDAGARVGPNPRELTCQVCHTPHGAAYDHLLVMGTDSNQLCLSCHDQMRPGMFREGGAKEHPVSPHVNAEQAAAVKDLGTRLSPDGRLICLSCHKLHHGKGQRFMLAADLAGGKMCIECHSDKTSVLDSSHDLRIDFPEERNRLGMTPITGGPCSACHLFHRFARQPETSDIDPSGQCITCHQAGRCAEGRPAGEHNHPPIQCYDCHNPHKPENGRFLQSAQADLCTRCHVEQAAVTHGPHDVTVGMGAWPAVSCDTENECLACHRPHSDADGVMFRAGLAEGVPKADASCLACHADESWNSTHIKSALHPRDASSMMFDPGLPLASGPGPDENTEIACHTCHNPHAAVADSQNLLRLAPGAPEETLCQTCHMDQRNIELTGHATQNLVNAGFKTEACQPCHNVHGSTESIETDLLWPVAFTEAVAEPVITVKTDLYCRACHRAGGAAEHKPVAHHPDVPMFNPFEPGAPGYLPLFDAGGTVDTNGRIGCRTCHVPHGREDATPVTADEGDPTPRENIARRNQLRPFRSPNVCVTCHGVDALRRYLYFHDPERRTGRITSQ